jgi:hypothetical protein
MFTVNRENFTAWTQGILLDNRHGHYIAGDDVACEEAEQRLQKGETIALTVRGEIVSTISFDGEAFTEVAVEDGK